jgi:hypothetical protein
LDQGFGQAPASKARAASDFNKDLSPNFAGGKKFDLGGGGMTAIVEENEDGGHRNSVKRSITSDQLARIHAPSINVENGSDDSF